VICSALIPDISFLYSVLQMVTLEPTTVERFCDLLRSKRNTINGFRSIFVILTAYFPPRNSATRRQLSRPWYLVVTPTALTLYKVELTDAVLRLIWMVKYSTELPCPPPSVQESCIEKRNVFCFTVFFRLNYTAHSDLLTVLHHLKRRKKKREERQLFIEINWWIQARP
jgi:hypothetical protein